MTYEVEPKRDEIKWDLGDWELIRRHPEVYRAMLPLLNRKMVIPEGIEVTTYTSTDNINPEPLFMLGAPGTGRGMIARRFHEFRLAATASERCDWCVPQGGFHDEFAHMAYIDGRNPFTLLNERVFRHGPPDPYPDCNFRRRLPL